MGVTREATDMTLARYREDMEMCCRCSLCKFIPVEMIKGYEHVTCCPSIGKYKFHAYSGGGRMNMGVAMLSGRIEFTHKLLGIVYNCQMCGACDISCKYVMDMEVMDPINEFRIHCVEAHHTIPALDHVISTLQKQGTMVSGSRVARGEWAEGLDVKDISKDKTAVIYHAGCRACFDERMWKIARATVTLMQEAGADVGIAREQEECCGGRAYQMGYKEDFLRQARRNLEFFKRSEAGTLVTGCADCYHSFKVLSGRFGMLGDLQVLHTTEYFDAMIKSGKTRPTQEVLAKVTYHDPCHLGRLGEPWVHRDSHETAGLMQRPDPPGTCRRGTDGVYQPPRDVIKSIPGLELVDMDRTREYAWCCGAGGGVKETNPGFAQWTARERIAEAESTGAEAIVTACPGCEANLVDALRESGSKLRVFDIVELLERATH
ncbi:MAG: (Fe-S)-binding protein [Thermodesulfobacteriota bacterium]